MESGPQEAPVTMAGWGLRIGPYRFFLDEREVAGRIESLPMGQVHHAPSWLAGVALVDARPLGVIDLGRFLGISRMAPGPILMPAHNLNSAWLFQVHQLEAVRGATGADIVTEDPALEARNPLASRKPPGFRLGRAKWTGADGLMVEGDVLSLSALLAHPRLRELQS